MTWECCKCGKTNEDRTIPCDCGHFECNSCYLEIGNAPAKYYTQK